jgi:hypothetical protein
MLERLRNQIGTAGLIVAIVALVAALGGGAYAATSSTGKATASAKQGKQGKQGKPGKSGPAGPQGPAGPAGPAGAAGAKGDTGAAGSNGTNGSPGAAGKSVISASFEGTDEPAGEPCEEQGGNSIEVEGSGVKRYACNGTAGAPGSPWTAGGTLPVGATETGAFTFFEAEPAEEGTAYAAISFPIPLAAPLDAAHVVHITTAENPDPVHCTGSQAEPKAASGYLCEYSGAEFGTEYLAITKPENAGGAAGASTAGALIKFKLFGELEAARSNGVFAVTG